MAVSSSLRFRVLRRDDFRCRYCGAKPDQSELHVDHVIPKSKGGPDTDWNLLTACMACNMGKGTGSANKFVLVDFMWNCIAIGPESSIEDSTVLYEVTPTPLQPVSVDEWVSRSPGRIETVIASVKQQGNIVRELGQAFTIERPMAEAISDYYELIECLYFDSADLSGKEALLRHLSRGPDFVVCWSGK